MAGAEPTVPAEPAPTADGPARRRASWNLRSIVEDVGGRPITDFQDPARPMHPYLRAHLDARAAAASAAAEENERYDPVGRVYPPLVGETGRALHGEGAEHHSETLASVTPAVVGPSGRPPHVPGPSHRPERIYLHYLLLHLDRLNDAALAYLAHAVDEERQHRARAAGPAPAPPLPTPVAAPAA
jgi:hypothetical protein